MGREPHACSHSQTGTSAGLHPVDLLLEEHEVILAVLEALEADATRLHAGGPFTRSTWERYPEFLLNFADRCHHGKEENLLFPALVERGVPDANGPIGVMKYEHEQGRSLVDRLSAAVAAAETARIVASASTFVGLLREHIAKENSVLFPLGKRMLDPETVARLRTEFARTERDLMGEGTQCRYLALAEAICADAGVDMSRTRGDQLGHASCGSR